MRSVLWGVLEMAWCLREIGDGRRPPAIAAMISDHAWTCEEIAALLD